MPLLPRQPQHRVIVVFALIAVSFYALARIALNPFIVWTALPLYIAYIQFDVAFETGRKDKLYAAIGFTLVSVGLSYLYHLAWIFDWDQTASGDAQAGLIFIFAPLYAALLGTVGYAIGWGVAWLVSRRAG